MEQNMDWQGEAAVAHDVDQGLAAALENGDIRSVGEKDGKPQMKLTSKGVTRVALMVAQRCVEAADREKRDFTAQEKSEIAEHLRHALTALSKVQ